MASPARYRRAWMPEAYGRDPRITDAALIGNLLQSATFFSSTTLLIFGASFALLGAIERGTEMVEVMRNLPLDTASRFNELAGVNFSQGLRALLVSGPAAATRSAACPERC